MDRVYLFVDGASMFYVQRDNGWHIDFRNVFQLFTDNREVAGAAYFTATPPVGEKDRYEKYRGFRSALIHMGYTVVDKEVKVITDPVTNQTKVKGNLDIELVFRMLTSIDSYDIAVLMGGDSDYVPIIEHLVNLGKRVIVAGRRQSTSTELVNVASQFIDLNDLRPRIEKRAARRVATAK
jgi:uncharacterized LabA/DUF88 family protein